MPYLPERMAWEHEDKGKGSADMSKHCPDLVNKIAGSTLLIDTPFLPEITFIQDTFQDLYSLMFLR